MVETSELFGLGLCLFLSGFFSGSEAVLMSIGVDRAKQLIEDGGKKGKVLSFMVEKPNEILVTILIGNNLVNILASALATTMSANYFDNDAIAISVGATTFFILIFGEIIPKTFARTHAEKLSIFVLRVLQTLYILMYPLVYITVWFIQKVLGENAQLSTRMITKNDIQYMVDKAEKEKTIDAKQLDLLNSILEFPKIKVKDIMVNRTKVKSLQIKSSFSDILKVTKYDKHSRYPVCNGDLENTLGFLHIKDLAFIKARDREYFKMERYLKAPFFVYEHMKIQAVFDHMNRKKVHQAMVKDETGLVVGIITLEDIIEEVMGEIQDEHDHVEDEIQAQYEILESEEGLTLDGSISLRDLYNEYDIKIPLNDNYSTFAGFILDMLGNNFPQKGQIIFWEGYSFEVVRLDNSDIKEIKIKDVDGEKHFFSKREVVDNEDESSEK